MEAVRHHLDLAECLGRRSVAVTASQQARLRRQRTLCLPATDQGGAPPPLAPALQSWEVEVERGDARGGHYGETLSLETSLGTVVGRRLLGGP